MSNSLRRCIFCSTPEIEARTVGRVIVAWCGGCGAEFCIEFNPADEPWLRARIERLDGDDDGGVPRKFQRVAAFAVRGFDSAISQA